MGNPFEPQVCIRNPYTGPFEGRSIEAEMDFEGLGEEVLASSGVQTLRVQVPNRVVFFGA